MSHLNLLIAYLSQHNKVKLISITPCSLFYMNPHVQTKQLQRCQRPLLKPLNHVIWDNLLSHAFSVRQCLWPPANPVRKHTNKIVTNCGPWISSDVHTECWTYLQREYGWVWKTNKSLQWCCDGTLRKVTCHQKSQCERNDGMAFPLSHTVFSSFWNNTCKLITS